MENNNRFIKTYLSFRSHTVKPNVLLFLLCSFESSLANLIKSKEFPAVF